GTCAMWGFGGGWQTLARGRGVALALRPGAAPDNRCRASGRPAMSIAQRATLAGLAAILTWSFLSLLTVMSGRVPPFQLAAMTFAIGGFLGAILLMRGGAAAVLRQPVAVWLLGV